MVVFVLCCCWFGVGLFVWLFVVVVCGVCVCMRVCLRVAVIGWFVVRVMLL